nr:MAG TPA: hypothetical protein [Caudoviricetes sp.]
MSVKYYNVCPVKSGSLRIVLFILCSGILFRSKRTEVPVLKKYGFPLRAVAFFTSNFLLSDETYYRSDSVYRIYGTPFFSTVGNVIVRS